MTTDTIPFIGRPLDRVEARLKVTGSATYPFEVQPKRRPAHGVIVPATIAKGRIASLDTRRPNGPPASFW